jgi:hypothetical protein
VAERLLTVWSRGANIGGHKLKNYSKLELTVAWYVVIEETDLF